jgi:hypothetical protein
MTSCVTFCLKSEVDAVKQFLTGLGHSGISAQPIGPNNQQLAVWCSTSAVPPPPGGLPGRVFVFNPGEEKWLVKSTV